MFHLIYLDMNAKQRLIQLFESGVNFLARTVIADGNYVCRKDNDNYTFLHESSPDVWRPLPEGTEPQNKTVLCLTNVPSFTIEKKKLKIASSIGVSVPKEYGDWPIGTYFTVSVSKGRTRIDMNHKSESEALNLVAKLQSETVE